MALIVAMQQIAMKEYPTFPKNPVYLSFTIILFSVIFTTFVGGRSCPHPLQRCSRCILLLQPTGLSVEEYGAHASEYLNMMLHSCSFGKCHYSQIPSVNVTSKDKIKLFNLLLIIIIIIIIFLSNANHFLHTFLSFTNYYLTPLEFFTSVLADSFSLEFE